MIMQKKGDINVLQVLFPLNETDVMMRNSPMPIAHERCLQEDGCGAEKCCWLVSSLRGP